MMKKKITKDGNVYNVWKVSEKTGFYLAEEIDIESKDAQELIADLTALCGELSAHAKSAHTHTKETAPGDTDESSVTDASDGLQNTANESPERKGGGHRSDERLPYLVRRSTGEKIAINKDIFRLGKDVAHADYFVDNNPTISRSHADIIHKKDGYYVKDKGSLNHTFVDGKKLEPEKSVRLEAGSLLQLSDEVFEFMEQGFDK